MWLDITSSSNKEFQDGNGNSLHKHVGTLKPLSTSGALQLKEKHKLPEQTVFTAKVRGRGCLVVTSPRVTRCHSHRYQEALKNLPAVTGWTSHLSRFIHDLLEPKSFGVAGICQGTCDTARAGARARQYRHAWSGVLSLLWDLPTYIWSARFQWNIRQPNSPPHLTEYYYRGYLRCHKAPSREGEKKSSHTWG